MEYRPPPISERYQAEVDRSTERLAAREAAAARKVALSEKRLASAIERKRPRLIEVERELLEIRRQELIEIQRMMVSAGSSNQHRGNTSRKKHRPVPQGSVL